MPATITINRPTYTDNDTLSAGIFNSVTVLNGTVPDATALALGVVQLAGDLGGSAASPTIAAKAVTYAKMQDVSATDKLLGRQSAGPGSPEEVACTAAGRAMIAAGTAAAQRDLLGVNDYIRANNDALTYAATVNLDFATTVKGTQTVTLAGNITFTSANLASGAAKMVRIIGDGSTRNLGFPGGWKFMGNGKPTLLAAGKTALLSLLAFGGTDGDVIANYVAEP